MTLYHKVGNKWCVIDEHSTYLWHKPLSYIYPKKEKKY